MSTKLSQLARKNFMASLAGVSKGEYVAFFVRASALLDGMRSVRKEIEAAMAQIPNVDSEFEKMELAHIGVLLRAIADHDGTTLPMAVVLGYGLAMFRNTYLRRDPVPGTALNLAAMIFTAEAGMSEDEIQYARVCVKQVTDDRVATPVSGPGMN